MSVEVGRVEVDFVVVIDDIGDYDVYGVVLYLSVLVEIMC